MPKKKILVFTIPNEGHLNILKKMILKNVKEFEFQLIIVGRKNTKPYLKDLPIKTVTLRRSNNFKNYPANKIFKRAYELMDEGIRVAKEFQPDLIIYDFAAFEGYFVGRFLNIPYWASIPGMMGPFIHQDYLRKSLKSKVNKTALAQIEEKYGIKVLKREIEVISNCLHIPGQLNLLWSYPTLTVSEFLKNRIKAKYVFIGYLKDEKVKKKSNNSSTPIVYFSLGTEVMDNLWVNQIRMRERLRKCIADIAERWKEKKIKVMYVTQGKMVLRKYPENWQVFDRVNQQQMLAQADLFITHGGSNSFHEAVLWQVPMIFIPFFGDQPLVAKQAQRIGIGINLVEDSNIDKKKPKNFLNEKLIDDLDKAAFHILETPRYCKTYDKLHLKHTSLYELIQDI